MSFYLLLLYIFPGSPLLISQGIVILLLIHHALSLISNWWDMTEYGYNSYVVLEFLCLFPNNNIDKKDLKRHYLYVCVCVYVEDMFLKIHLNVQSAKV